MEEIINRAQVTGKIKDRIVEFINSNSN